MNYVVHSLMYSYYACKALRIPLPKSLAMFITLSQILQMLVGFYVTYYSFINSENCHKQKEASFFGLLMYGSYFVLFVDFFINVYFNNGKFTKKGNDNSLIQKD